MARSALPRRAADTDGDSAGTRRHRSGPLTGRRIAAGAAIAVVAAGLAVLPGLGNGPEQGQLTPLEQTLAEAASAEPQRPTFERVQELVAELNELAGDQPVDPELAAAVVTEPGEYQALGQLQIPAIGLDVEVGNGVDPQTLTLGPGHWPGTPVPGQPGNAVISGHRTTHTAPFLDLDALVPGDEIVVTSLAGVETTYEVTEQLVVPVADYTSEVLAQPDDADVRELTLFACHPEGSLTHRIVIHAIAAPSGA